MNDVFSANAQLFISQVVQQLFESENSRDYYILKNDYSKRQDVEVRMVRRSMMACPLPAELFSPEEFKQMMAHAYLHAKGLELVLQDSNNEIIRWGESLLRDLPDEPELKFFVHNLFFEKNISFFLGHASKHLELFPTILRWKFHEASPEKDCAAFTDFSLPEKIVTISCEVYSKLPPDGQKEMIPLIKSIVQYYEQRILPTTLDFQQSIMAVIKSHVPAQHWYEFGQLLPAIKAELIAKNLTHSSFSLKPLSNHVCKLEVSLEEICSIWPTLMTREEVREMMTKVVDVVNQVQVLGIDSMQLQYSQLSEESFACHLYVTSKDSQPVDRGKLQNLLHHAFTCWVQESMAHTLLMDDDKWLERSILKFAMELTLDKEKSLPVRHKL